jgi:hypothetical protein
MLTPKFSKSVISLLISIISGILLIITFLELKELHIKSVKLHFFAPCGVISPLDGCPFYFKIPYGCSKIYLSHLKYGTEIKSKSTSSITISNYYLFFVCVLIYRFSHFYYFEFSVAQLAVFYWIFVCSHKSVVLISSSLPCVRFNLPLKAPINAQKSRRL